MNNETYAKFDPETGQPTNLTPRDQIRIPNSNGQEHRLSDDQLLQLTGYRKLVQDTSIPEGARIDGQSWSIDGTTIVQTVTAYTTAEDVEAERIAALANSNAADVQLLAALLTRFGYTIPVPDPEATVQEIKQKLASGQIPQADEGAVAILDRVYRDLKSVMTDDDITAIAQLGGAE